MATILAVDDDSDMLELIKYALEIDHEVIAVENGHLAIRVFQERSVDLVVTDFQMPGMTGVGLAEIFRAQPGKETVPIIIVSAVDPYGRDPREIISLWLRKPFSPRRLRAEVAKSLGRNS